ncbi:MAG TPA: FAD-dependent oxidoreductase [Polyangiaceae bacterium]
MGHGIFFKHCRRLLRTAYLLESKRVSTADGIARLQEMSFTRRKLLQSGALAGATVLGACAPSRGAKSPSSPSSARVVVVGAGLAGLSAAWRLGQQGYRPLVFEASSRAGGRAYTLRNFFASKAELGGELIDSGQTTIRKLVPELGLRLLDLSEESQNLEPVRFFFRNTRYSEAEMIDSFRPVAAQILADRAGLNGHFAFANFDRDSQVLRAIDRMSLDEWMTKHHVGEPVRSLIDAAYAAEYGCDIGEQSSLNMMLMIGTDLKSLLIYGESDWRFTVAEGSDAIARELANRLVVPVAYEHVFESLKEQSDGSLLLTFKVGNSTKEVVADQVAMTIPFSVLRRCQLGIDMPPIKREAIDTLQYGLHAKVLLGTESRPWRGDKTSGTSFHDTVFQASWDSALPGEQGVLTMLSGGSVAGETTKGTTEEQGERNAVEADRIFPKLRGAYKGRTARVYWPSMPYNLGSYACYAPGQYTGIGGHEGDAVKNLHFGGEHTSKAYQGWLVGAIGSGERVAREITSALGR